VRSRTRFSTSANVLMLIPLVTPEIVAGVSAQNAERARSDDRCELGRAVTVGWLPEHSLVLR
jgi:hypothetical protein